MRFCTLLGVAWVLGGPHAWGQAAAPGPAPTQPSISVSEVSGTGQLIRVSLNKAVLVSFPRPARDVRLANPEIAEATAISPKQIMLTGKSFGTTQLIVWFEENSNSVFDVAVELDLERLAAAIRAAVPRAQVRPHALLDAVVLTGSVPDADAAKRVQEIAGAFSQQVINHLNICGVQQVLLRCTVAEVNRSATRQLGFNGWLGGDNFPDVFAVNQLDQINPINIGAAADAVFSPPIAVPGVPRNIAGRVPFLSDEDGIPISSRTTLSFGFPRLQMQVFIRALRENGLLRVLAEPNLVAISGQNASFLAGGEIPIPIVTDERIRIEFKEFGVRLNFTPAVLNENTIRLQVSPEISEPDFANSVTVSGVAIPGFTSRRVQTVVELGSGQTFAIGGLLSERTRAVARKVPALGDVPVLGALFSSTDYQSDETELVVLVTPELVEPVSSDQVTKVPGAHYVPPNDFELFLMGQTDGATRRELPEIRPRPTHTWPVRPTELYGEAGRLRGPIGLAGSEEGQ